MNAAFFMIESGLQDEECRLKLIPRTFSFAQGI